MENGVCIKLYCSLFQLTQRAFCGCAAFFPPSPQSYTQTVFLYLFLLLLCPGAFFGLFVAEHELLPLSTRTVWVSQTSPSQGPRASLSRPRDPWLLAAKRATGWGSPQLSI